MNSGNKISNSMRWSSMGEILAKLIVPITNMILARVLMPEDFGVLASINMIISFVDLFTDSGFSKYIIQCDFRNEREKNEYINVAFLTNLSISLVMYVLILFFRNSVAKVAGSKGYGNVIAVASLQLIVTSFSSIQTALYRRNFDFKTLFVTRVMMAIIPMIVTVPLAIITRSYWSLAIGTLISATMNAVVLTIKSQWKPFIYYSFAQLKKMLSFSIWSLAEAVAYWLTTWVDVFIIGVAFSAHYLGLYKNSLNMVNSIMALVKASIVPVLFASLSRLKQNQEEFENVYFRIQRLAACLLIPMGVGLFVYRDFATLLMFGAGWEEAADIVGAWALASSFFIVYTAFNGEAYKAKGVPKILFAFEIVYLIFMIPICVFAKNLGFWPLVYVRSILSFLQILIGFAFMEKFLRFSIGKMITNILPPLVSACLMGFLGEVLRGISNSYLWNFFSIMLCAAFYFVILWLLFRKIIKDDLKVFKENYQFK